VVDPDHEAVRVPKFNVVAVHELLCPNRSDRIAIAYECSIAGEVSVFANDIGAVLCHRLLFWWG
jgi:hypothetical protein